MKLFIITLLISTSLFALKLKAGDILLQPLHCRLCNLIEAQTSSIYSHIGVVINDKSEIAEAFISVRKVTLVEFLSKTQKKQKVKVLRPKFDVVGIENEYLNKYANRSYDSEFLWDNFDEKGERIYCSELVYKLLAIYSTKIPEPLPMKYDVNTDLWFKFFKGNIPFNKLGISPSMFDDEEMFSFIGEI